MVRWADVLPNNDGVEGRAWDPGAVNPWVLVAACPWVPGAVSQWAREEVCQWGQAAVFPSALVAGFQSDQGEECLSVRVVANP